MTNTSSNYFLVTILSIRKRLSEESIYISHQVGGKKETKTKLILKQALTLPSTLPTMVSGSAGRP